MTRLIVPAIATVLLSAAVSSAAPPKATTAKPPLTAGLTVNGARYTLTAPGNWELPSDMQNERTVGLFVPNPKTDGTPKATNVVLMLRVTKQLPGDALEEYIGRESVRAFHRETSADHAFGSGIATEENTIFSLQWIVVRSGGTLVTVMIAGPLIGTAAWRDSFLAGLKSTLASLAVDGKPLLVPDVMDHLKPLPAKAQVKPVLKTACDGGEAVACRSLAYELRQSDQAGSKKLLKKACELGDAFACNILGMYAEDETLAFEFFHASCEHGDWTGCEHEANLNCSGRAEPENVPVVRRPQDDGSLKRITPLHEELPKACTGPALDSMRRAAKTIGEACARDDSEACVTLARMRPEEGGPAKPDGRIKLLQQACDLGNASACEALGYEYIDADGVAKDMKEALRWLRRACELGEQDLCFVLDTWQSAGIGPAPDAGPAGKSK